MIPSGEFRFRIVGPIGEGGFGIVDEIEVTDSNCHHPVGLRLARKRLKPQWAAHPVQRQRFEREIATLRAIDGHPNVITVKGEDLGTGERFYCMQKCAKSARGLLYQFPQGFQWRYVAGLGITLARALSHAHGLGFVHRDLKPENILFDDLNNVYVADWGIGYFVHQHSVVMPKLTQGGIGTGYYCSLEQWVGHKSHATMDVYALAMTLAELVQGQQIPGFSIGMGIQTDIVAAQAMGSMMFNAVLRQMSAPLVGNRVASMDHVVAVLGQVLANAATPGRL